MKLSYSWLKDYLKCELGPAQIAEAMTSIGIEVDGVEEQEKVPGGLAGVVVAKVLECEVHPNSDHLHITRVDDGTGEPLVVVCGAPNVAAGQKVLFARIGAVLPGDFKIKKSKIRGVESFGMICAEDELGIGESHDGIMVLPDDAVVGTPAKEYLHLETEAVIEYEITANRVDAASHWGVARDLYAWMKLRGISCELVRPSVDAFREGAGNGLDVEVLDADGAPRYMGITIRNVKVAPSPQWMQDRLLAIGLRPIDNIVDISNFVLFELGQPLHTFDADKVNGGKVIVRRAADGEVIRTLDGVERKLCSRDMVIANSDAPMCIAGVFGGEESGVSDSTVSLFVESAYFDPGSIRKTSKTLGLQTDASFRYERGADPEVLEYALKRAVTLILEYAGGEVEGGIKEVFSKPVERKIIELDYDRIERLAGHELGHDTIENILGWLGYEFVERRDGGSVVKAPSYMVDVYRECDVVEELLRIYGYDNIPFPKHMKMSVNATPRPEEEAVRNNVSNFLAANGFVEIMNNSLTKSAYYDRLKTFPAEHCVHIVNPLSQDLNVMRQSLVPGGLEVVAYNLNRQASAMKIFEYGSVYSRLPEKSAETLDGYEEHTNFMLMITGTPEKSWRLEPAAGNYFQLKGYVELLLARYGAELSQLRTEAAPSDIYSEGMVYRIQGGSSMQLAVLGTVNPALAKSFGIKQPVFAAEISWPALFELVRRDKVAFKELPKFPEVRRDLALLLDESVKYADLRAAAFKQAKKLLKQVRLFDVYRGDKIPEGKKQYAMSFVIQDTERTLTDQDTERVMDRLLTTFQNEFGAQLR
ncbi:MAG TPA: phenylalanine--tRNA ligase subunit beta [Candidatus Cryptobacteroides merdipullorum]|uniref:Phenylalanine--tRNA ligase beta subunit n=1 Tax=Candidatus Cryptobacteroides merdipullorum TaxID=2840771 RepID=A0A9D1GPU6_9BACT|nr:phenylalanine--tRNA ligase subunit beta [Candidatus Cryptobacteroides merdipullorum]